MQKKIGVIHKYKVMILGVLMVALCISCNSNSNKMAKQSERQEHFLHHFQKEVLSKAEAIDSLNVPKPVESFYDKGSKTVLVFARNNCSVCINNVCETLGQLEPRVQNDLIIISDYEKHPYFIKVFEARYNLFNANVLFFADHLDAISSLKGPILFKTQNGKILNFCFIYENTPEEKIRKFIYDK